MSIEVEPIIRGTTHEIWVRWTTDGVLETLSATNYGELHILKDGDSTPTEYSTETASQWTDDSTGYGHFVLPASLTDDWADGDLICFTLYLIDTAFTPDRYYFHGSFTLPVQDPVTIALANA